MQKLSTKKVKDYLKTLIDSPKWYIGKSDNSQEASITLYGNKRKIGRISSYQSLQTYSVLPTTLLLRWGLYYDEAENKANEIYELLKSSSFFVDNYKCFCNCIDEGPNDLRH